MASGEILVVEDERNIASLLELYLSKEGYSVTCVDSGTKALEAAGRIRPSLVILDVMLPEIDGFEVCRRLRATSRVPVIMLTARDTEVDRILGLELGADDYVTKPFSPRELLARVKAVLRRMEGPEEEVEILELGPVAMNLARRETRVAGQPVDLTAKEFDLLGFLLRNRGIVFTRDRLLDRVWGYKQAVDSRTVDSHVRSLRAKLGEAAEVIQTLRGVGYRAEWAGRVDRRPTGGSR
ncbi:MAG: response regulator transcription factor [Actinomycetota bacterium]